MALSPLGRGGSPDGLAIPFRLQLVELSQLARSFSGPLAHPACAHVRTRYAESSGFGAALRTPVVLGHWLVRVLMVPGEYLSSRPVLDELDYLPIDKHRADLLFQIVAARYEVGSIVITTNRPFREWDKIFDVDNTLATALIDRLMHHGEGIVIQGDSYRMKYKDHDSIDE
jgi:IstB-like ATP binding protein